MLIAVDGMWGAWTGWDPCDANCDTGYQNRTRLCDSPVPQYGGADCVGNDYETQTCNTHNCPSKYSTVHTTLSLNINMLIAVDGMWGAWTGWDPCDANCDTGYQNRTRLCDSPVPQYGGADCVGNDYETQTCNTHNCPSK